MSRNEKQKGLGAMTAVELGAITTILVIGTCLVSGCFTSDPPDQPPDPAPHVRAPDVYRMKPGSDIVGVTAHPTPDAKYEVRPYEGGESFTISQDGGIDLGSFQIRTIAPGFTPSQWLAFTGADHLLMPDDWAGTHDKGFEVAQTNHVPGVVRWYSLDQGRSWSVYEGGEVGRGISPSVWFRESVPASEWIGSPFLKLGEGG